MKKFTTLLFALLLTIPAVAYNSEAGTQFYFVKPESWNLQVTQFFIGHSGWSIAYEMNNIENTGLYYTADLGKWEGCYDYAVINNEALWGGESKSIQNRMQYSAFETGVGLMTEDFSKTILLSQNIDGSNSNNYKKYESFESLNHTQTVTIDGGEGTISMSSYNLTAANTAKATNGTTSVSAVYTANVTCTATAADGYRFVGWYNGETLLSDKPTYTYVAENADKTIVAKFEEVTAETPVLSNFTASATEVMVGDTITFTCAVENGEVANIVYKINNEAIVGNTWTPEACGVYTATATYEGATPVELASTITVKEEVVFNVTVPVGTPACYIVGNFNGQNWDSFNPMEEVDDTHYSWSFITTTMDFAYKYTCAEGWDNVEVNADGSDVANRTWSENDVVAMFKGYENYSENITYNNSYLLDVAEIGWKDADAQFAAWFYNKNMPDNNAVLVQGFTAQVDGLANVILFYLDENHIKDNLKVDEAFNFTHVVFLRLKPEYEFSNYTVYPVESNDETNEVWNKVETYCPGANKYFQLTDWNAGEWKDIATGVNRVELAGGIGYAYGVVSAEGAIEVYNVNGAVVARGNDNVDLRGLGRGVYIIRNGNQVRKVVR